MPKAGCGLDRLEWYKVERLIKEFCAQSNLTITVYDQSKEEQSQKQDKTQVRSALGQAQRRDEALSKLIEWIERGKVSIPQELQGLPRLACQLNNQFKSLQLIDGILCRRFETADNQVVLQQIVPPSMTQEILSTCHSSATAGHLGVAKTPEKTKIRLARTAGRHKIVCQPVPGRSKTLGTTQEKSTCLIEWQASYPFHHIGIDFMGPFVVKMGPLVVTILWYHFVQ